ncbi:phenylacetate--CoA ligase family protein, partial [Chloroflexota bacterium]
MVIAGRPDEYFDKQETMTPEKRAEYLNRRLHETIASHYEKAPAVKNLLDGVGIKPADIRTVLDLEKLPITRKTELIQMQRQQPPYGGFSAITAEDIERVFISPGPIYEPIQHSGIKWFGKAFKAAGFRKGDVVVNTFTYHMSPAGVLFHEAIRDCGATVVPAGTGNTEVLIQAMYDMGVTGFVGTPSFLMSVIKRAEEMGYDFKKDFNVKIAWFTGEMLAPSVRHTLEKGYNIFTSQAYAVTEPGGAIAYECYRKNGMHIMDDYVLEIVDPDTGKQLGPGEVGEIVVTPIHNPNWGLVRFGTGDMSSYINSPCPCGRTSTRITGIIGRTGDAVKVRGMFVVAKQAEAAITSYEQVAHSQLIVQRKKNRDELILRLELNPKYRGVGADWLTKEMSHSF